jgi:hypothetical protein
LSSGSPSRFFKIEVRGTGVVRPTVRGLVQPTDFAVAEAGLALTDKELVRIGMEVGVRVMEACRDELEAQSLPSLRVDEFGVVGRGW